MRSEASSASTASATNGTTAGSPTSRTTATAGSGEPPGRGVGVTEREFEPAQRLGRHLRPGERPDLLEDRERFAGRATRLLDAAGPGGDGGLV